MSKTIAQLIPAGLIALTALSAQARAPLLKPVLQNDETFTESFVLIADLDDGTYVLAQLGISNAGPGDGNGACKLLIAKKGQKAWTAEKLFKRKDWSYTEAPTPTLKIDQCRAEATKDQLRFVAAVGGGTLDLTLKGSAEEARHKAHQARAGKSFYELEVLVPWGEVEAKYAKKGERLKTVKGYGYSDHSRANALPTKIASRWVRFRSFNKQDPTLLLLRFPPQGKAVGWHWKKGQDKSNVTRAMARSKKVGGKDAWMVMVDGDGGPWRVVSKQLLFRNAPLEDKGVLGSMLGTMIGNPVTYTFRAVLESKRTRKKVSGIFEIALTDE